MFFSVTSSTLTVSIPLLAGWPSGSLAFLPWRTTFFGFFLVPSIVRPSYLWPWATTPSL